MIPYVSVVEIFAVIGWILGENLVFLGFGVVTMTSGMGFELVLCLF